MKLSPIFDFDMDDLLSAEHAAYGPLVRDALAFFIQRLPPFRRVELAAAQGRLPSNSSTAQRLVALFKQCPTLHKLGQVLARDERLTAKLRTQLQLLETFPPTVEVASLRAAIDRAIGDMPGISIADQALAEASVAVVVPFTWRRNPRAEPVQGVLKVLKADIRARLDQELEAWSELGAYVERRCEDYGLPDLDYQNIIDGVSNRLQNEVVLAYEQTHLKEAAQLYENVPGIRVPESLPFCTDDVTAMTRIDGVKLTNVPLAQRAHAARLLSDALIARPLLSGNVRAPFHADPHPGNLLLTDNGELGILDWSLVVRLDENERRAFERILRSALGLDEAGLVRGLEEICTQPPSIDDLRRVAGESVRQLRWGAQPGLRWITAMLDRAVLQARIRISDDLTLFRKSLHTLTGVVGELSSLGAIDTALIARAMRRYVDDTADAMVNPAAASSSTAAVTNAALFGLWVDAPAVASRYWLGVWRDVLTNQRA